MTETTEPIHISDEYEANVSLIYDYVEKSITEVQDISNNSNTKLGLLIGFNLTFIRFFITILPGSFHFTNSLPCNSCLLFKVMAYIFSIFSIVFCFKGLYSNTEYFIIPPNLLIDQCEKSNSTALKLAIIKTWDTKLEKFVRLAEHKKELFNY